MIDSYRVKRNLRAATYRNSIISDGQLAGTKWVPAFDSKERTFDYVRVRQISSPHWTNYDANIIGDEIPGAVPTAIQERA